MKRGIDGTNEVYESYFIFGQELDLIRPPYLLKMNYIKKKVTEFDMEMLSIGKKKIMKL